MHGPSPHLKLWGDRPPVSPRFPPLLEKYNLYRPLEAAGTDEVVYAGHGNGTRWEGMMDEEHEKGWERQRTKGRPP